MIHVAGAVLCVFAATCAQAADLDAAHQLIEQYFASPDSASHRVVVSQLVATGIDPNVLGQMCHERQGWQDVAPGVYYINEKIGPHAVKYFLGVPKGYRHAVAWPLVVKLPAANVFVTDPRPDAEAVVGIYTNWINEELADHPDALVLMPLLNLSELYGPSYAGMN